MRIPRTLALVLAGGAGSRLSCLTQRRPKPVLPMGGTYRLIDIALSNLAHSHITDVGLVEQYLPRQLNDYLSAGRPWDLDRNHGGLQVLPPFEGGSGAGFASGNADSMHRQRDFIRDSGCELVLVLSADHLYTMNFLEAISTHLDARADLTIVTTRVDERADRYGVVTVDDRGRVTGFDYKPDEPAGNLVATEVFVYDAAVLLETMEALAADGELADFGHELVPWLVENRRVVEHRHHGYWIDVGTIQSYWTANLQLLDGDGVRLDDPTWAIWSAQPQLPPARVATGASVSDSFLSSGSTVEGTVEHSVIGTNAVVEAGAVVRDSVLLDGVRVSAGVELRNCVVDIGATVSGGSTRGSEGVITLINSDGVIDRRETMNTEATLPRGFA